MVRSSIKRVLSGGALVLCAACDGGGGSNLIEPPPINAPPVVDAGVDQRVDEADVVFLRGTVTDPEGDPLAIRWS